MYNLKTIKKTLKILEKNNFKFTKTARETGIKARTIRSWYNRQRANQPLLIRPYIHTKAGKRSKEEMKIACDYFFEHGESVTATVNILGYPKPSTLKYWLKKDKRWIKKRKMNFNPNSYSLDDKILAVEKLITDDRSTSEIAKEVGVSTVSLYIWQKQLTGEKLVRRRKKDNKELLDEIKNLSKERDKLVLENKILQKANELLKKEMGANYEKLTNKEKTLVVSALENEYKKSTLFKMLNIKKSTYYYEKSQLFLDKYEKIKELISNTFYANYSCYGYRRIKIALKIEYGLTISEKVIRRLMKELNLKVYQKRKRKYSSYQGEITPEVPNIINRDFKADKKYEKLLTDITEFSLADGKVYLSPLIDCYDGLPVVYTIGKAPTTDLTNDMLIKSKDVIKDEKPIVHNDRGFHYRVPTWINLMEEYGFTRSMSKKGCSPDNSMCEGFFGTIKNEFFYPRDWFGVSCD